VLASRIQVEHCVRLGRRFLGWLVHLHLCAVFGRQAAPVGNAGIRESGSRFRAQAQIQRQPRIAGPVLGVIDALQFHAERRQPRFPQARFDATHDAREDFVQRQAFFDDHTQHLQRRRLARIDAALASAAVVDGFQLFRERGIALGVVAHAAVEFGIQEWIFRASRGLAGSGRRGAGARLFFGGHDGLNKV
jgi:hypothetical protein